MRSPQSWVEYLIIGTGSALAFILVLLIFFEVKLFPPEGSEILSFIVEEAYWMAIIPMIALIYVAGLIQDRIAFLLFRPWERNLRRYAIAADGDANIDHYYRVRSFFFTSPGTQSMVNLYFQNRAKIRMFRAWTLNAIIIASLLAYREATTTYFHPYQFPVILIFGLLALGCIWAWYSATNSEHKVLNRFNLEMMGM